MVAALRTQSFCKPKELRLSAISTAPLNESVTDTVRSWGVSLKSEYNPAEDDTFTLIDVSEPEFFDKIVNLAKVDEVIDHHPGFEEYWQKRIGSSADIEFIGAACTMVYERWKAADLFGKMSDTSARLLICGILDNTLNFNAKVTTQRDIDAYNTLLTRADLPSGWTAQYFTECQEAILRDAVTAVRNDTKTLQFRTYMGPMRVGQLVVWDGKQVFTKYKDVLRSALSESGPDWFINLISISERKNYFITDTTWSSRVAYQTIWRTLRRLCRHH